MQEFLCSIGILFVWPLHRLISLEWIRFLRLRQKETLAADYRILTAAACSTAVSLFAHLSGDVPDHEGGEDGDTGEVEHEDAEAGEEAEAGEGFEGG